MACTDWDGVYLDALKDGAFQDAILCPYQDNMGGVVFALFVYGAIGTAIYVRTDSIIIPFVLVLLTGGIVMTEVASIAVGLVITMLLFVVGIGPILLLKRMGL